MHRGKVGAVFIATLIRYVDKRFSLSYVPLIAPSTTLRRIKFLASIADSFIYVVSKVSLRTLSLFGMFQDLFFYRWALQDLQTRLL